MSKRKLMQLAFEDMEEASRAQLVAEPSDGLVEVDDADLQGALDDSNEIDELISTTGVVEKIEEAVQSTCDEGGLGYPTAQALDVAFEHFKRSAGLPCEKSLSLEGLKGGRNTRIYTTKLALEEIGETIRRLVRRIIAWIKHIATVCYEIIERLMRGANAVIDRAHLVYKAAAGISHNKFAKDKVPAITKSSLVSFFNESGRPMNSHEIESRFKKYCDEVNHMFNAGQLYAPAVRGLSEMERYINGHGEKAVDMDAVERFAEASCDELTQKSLNRLSKRQVDGADVLFMELPFGNSDLLFSFAHGSVDSSRRVGFHVSIQPNPVQDAAPLDALRPQDVMNLMSLLISEMGRGIYRESKKIKSAIYDVQVRVEKESYRLSDRQRLMGASVVPSLQLVKLISDSSLKLTRLLYSYTGISTRRLLSYAESSIAAYEKAIIK
jgi:hypothetical protein